jgi:hypothetical protein
MLPFVHDTSEDAPLCRWKLGALTVDIMPTEESILGFTNPWYREGVSTLIPIKVGQNGTWRILAPPYALAAKCVAFTNRGAPDPSSSSDLEDIVTLVNGRPSLCDEVSGGQQNCKAYLSSWFDERWVDASVRESIPYHLSPHASGQARLQIVLDRMKRIADLR